MKELFIVSVLLKLATKQLQELFDDFGNFLNIARLLDFFFSYKVRLSYSHLDIDELFQHFNNEIVVEDLAVFIVLHSIFLSNNN